MSIKAKPSFSLKDQLFNADSVATLARNLTGAYPAFRDKAFQREVLAQFPDLELKARIDCMASALSGYLPSSFPDAVAILKTALPAPLDPELTDNDFGQFIWSVPGEFVASNGCSQEHLPLSLEFLGEVTQRFSAEWAIRPFLLKFPEETLKSVHEWVVHDHYHVRRLASEGIRPFLPWGQRVLLPPPVIIEVLDHLHTDPSRFVTRSVANTLNDLSRIDAKLVLATLRRWQKVGRQDPAELQWMTRHALRTLTKTDHAEALELLGYPTVPRFRINQINIAESVTVGDTLRWQATLTSLAEQSLKVVLRLHFLKANGKHSAKVFAVKDLQAAKGERVELAKTVSFKPMTTRTLYPGEHRAEVVVNGVARGLRTFELVVA